MVGKTKSVSFPAKISATADKLTLAAAFSIDRTEWGMNYGKGKIDDMVKLSVSLKAAK
jgi:polyisoprenoid-binding protein YceI